MDGVLVILLGVAAMGGAAGVLRTYGPRLRVGRLLGSTPIVSIAEAVALATASPGTYVRVAGRIDSETDFEDTEHRPLVYRRTRFQAREGRRWTNFDVVTEVVPFEIGEGLDHIQIDGAALGDGLVVVPRETTGVVGDLGDRAADDLADDLPARVIIEAVSSIEHAVVLGIPSIGADGTVLMTAGRGRPLVLSTLEDPEAMRILAGGSVVRARIAAILLVAATVLIALGIVLLILPGTALAASPTPTPALGSDTRSAGEGPGLVGAPLAAILAVVGIGLIALLVTLAFVRLTGDRTGREADR